MERINMMKDIILMNRKVRGTGRKINLTKKAGFNHWVEIIITCAVLFIIALAAKEPLSNLGSWVTGEVSRIVKAWFTGL